MRRLEKLDWSRNAHLHNVMLGLPNPHRFWQTGKADVSAEWWLRNSGDNRRATFLFSASFQQLLLLHCGLAGACGCGAGASSQEQSQCSAVNISYQSPAPSLPWILLTGRCRGWNQIQHVHYWIIFGFTAAKQGKMREAKPASLLHELELFQVPVLYLNTLVFQGWSFVGSPKNQ